MKQPVLLMMLITCLWIGIRGQEDLSRDQRLPSRIGGNTCNAGARANSTVTGFLNVQGVQDGKTHSFSVALFAGGALIGRHRLKNGGSFTFYCVPNENVRLIAEADSVEIGTFTMGLLNAPPFSNRQDIIVAMPSDRATDQKRSQVISAQTAYDRGGENQKLFDRANEELQKSNSGSAAKLLQQIVENDPKDFVAWLKIGDIHFNENRFDEAEKAYETSLGLKEGSMSAMIGVGRSALNTKNTARAVEVLTMAVKVKPDSADANHYLGEAYLQARKGSLAIVHLNKAIELDPNRKAELHLRLAALYNAARAPGLAANEYKMFLQKRPDYPEKVRMEKFIQENSN
jgi:cytochrome c-type biogenesis protein CcmH/NrfG